MQDNKKRKEFQQGCAEIFHKSEQTLTVKDKLIVVLILAFFGVLLLARVNGWFGFG